MRFSDLESDLVGQYPGGFSLDELTDQELMADADDDYEYSMPNDTEIWL